MAVSVSPALKASLAKIEAVVIGASAGGIEALKTILPRVLERFPAPVLVVQHIGAKSSGSLVQFFRTICSAPVKEVEDKESMLAGTIYFAPPGYHVLIESDHTFALNIDPPVSYSRPSIDVSFQAAADVFGAKTLAIVLTGANQDGAAGFHSIVSQGGIGVVQTPETAAYPAMPLAAAAAIAPTLILSLSEIAELVSELEISSFSDREA